MQELYAGINKFILFSEYWFYLLGGKGSMALLS
jgi:hypothetical protein